MDGGGGTSAAVTPASVSGTADTAVTAAVGGLAPNTTYYFAAQATNVGGTTQSFTQSFQTLGNPPGIQIANVTSATRTSASLNAFVLANGTPTRVMLLCSQHSNFPAPYTWVLSARFSPFTGSGWTAANRTVTGLQPGTTYWVRAVAINEAGESWTHTISFKTLKR